VHAIGREKKMIISHEHKFIFLKTRKTAGTSIEIALSRFCGERDIITPISPADEMLRQKLSHRGPQNFQVHLTTPDAHAHLSTRKRVRQKQIGYYNHMPAEEVRATIGTATWDEYYKFCFERNPWDKAISRYFHRSRTLARRGEPRLSLLEFLRSENPDKLSNFGIYSIDETLAVDYVGLYENLDTELERIAAVLNLPGKKIELPKAKGTSRTDRRHYKDVMGQEERNIVAQVCAREIQLFSYRF
jgi:Sulfotransferase family